MKLYKFSLFCLFTFLSLLVLTPAFAVETPPLEIKKDINSSFISDIGLYNAKIISQDGNNINISFDIAGGTISQSDLRYTVGLIKEKNTNQTTVHEYIYPEKINPLQKETIKKDIVYNAPSNLTGEYILFVKIINKAGLTLAIGLPGKVNIKSTEDALSISIIKDTCYLYINGQKDNPKYGLTEGLDIYPSEDLMMNCDILNSSKKDITVIPVYETYYGSLYGERVEIQGGDVTPILFKEKEKKSVKLSLPRSTKPSIYKVKVSFKSDEVVLASTSLDYKILGKAAIIKDFSLDKDSYKNGDTANLRLKWSYLSLLSSIRDSKDIPISARENINGETKTGDTHLSLSITDGMDRKCIKNINQILDNKNSIFSINSSLIRDCKNPQVSVSITDSEGTILDSKEFSFGGPVDYTKLEIFFAKYGIIIFIIIALFGSAVYFINLKKKGHIESDLIKENETNI
jgi:hypothetical protein